MCRVLPPNALWVHSLSSAKKSGKLFVLGLNIYIVFGRGL